MTDEAQNAAGGRVSQVTRYMIPGLPVSEQKGKAGCI